MFWKGHVAIARGRNSLIHANAFHMAVAIEPVAEALARIARGRQPSHQRAAAEMKSRALLLLVRTARRRRRQRRRLPVEADPADRAVRGRRRGRRGGARAVRAAGRGLGQSVVIDNRGGAGGIIGMDAVAKSPADGYTLLLAHSGLTYMPGLYRKLPFDPVKDFDGVITAVSGSYVLAVNNDAPFKSVAELIAYAKAHPGKLTYGSAGIGSTLHLAAEFFKRAAGIDILHVPYKGAAQATTDLVGGQVQMMFGPTVAILPLAQAGKIRALAVTSPKRSALAPDLPTMIESGVPASR